jgi:23S rRNA G2069 N7-methylase RlmK/C1962 C5-methylase RlmI
MNVEKLISFLAAKSAFDPADTSLRRILKGAEDGFAGVWADKFGPMCVITVYSSLENEQQNELLKELGVYTLNGGQWLLKVRNIDKTSFDFFWSSDDLISKVFCAQENHVNFQIRCDPRHDFGVFTDAAFARQLVNKICKNSDNRMLNLFSYTCGFGLVAAKNGISKVVNVDPNKEYLAWGKENAAINNVDFSVVPETAQKYLHRLVSRKQKGVDVNFDCVVIDPPAFGVGRGSERLLRTLWPEILQAVVQLSPKHVVLMFNDLYLRKTKNVREMVEKNLGPGWTQEWFRSDGSLLTSASEVDHCMRNPADAFFAEPLVAHFWN